MAKTGLYLGNVAIGRIITVSSSAFEPNLQTKSVTPIKEEQTIVPDSGYDGLSMVNVAAIPEQYQDVSVVTADASDIVEGKKIVTTTGTVSGTMPDNGTVNKILDTVTTNYTIAAGKHSGEGKISIVTQEKNVTPSEAIQEIVPDAGMVLSKVTVAASTGGIDTSDATATAGDILLGETAYVNDVKLIGTMPNQGAISGTIDGINTETYVIPSGYHNGSGTVSLTNDIQNEVTTQENIIAEINAILDAKASAYPTITYDASTQTLSITEVEG